MPGTEQAAAAVAVVAVVAFVASLCFARKESAPWRRTAGLIVGIGCILAIVGLLAMVVTAEDSRVGQAFGLSWIFGFMGGGLTIAKCLGALDEPDAPPLERLTRKPS